MDEVNDLDLTEFCNEEGNVIVEKIVQTFYSNGIVLFRDPRLEDFLEGLTQKLSGTFTRSHLVNSHLLQSIPRDQFITLLKENPVAYRVLHGDLVVEDFAQFSADLKAAYESVRDDNSGEVTTYIPGLSTYDMNKWAVSFCSIDGQVYNVGDTDDPFTIQSCTKPILYGLTCDEVGTDTVHSKVGREPSGFGFNKIKLGYGDMPHNPLINMGAITVVSMISPEMSLCQRFETYYGKYKDLAAGFHGDNISFNNVVYLSERQSGHRNYAIGHYLLNKGCIETASTNRLMEILELYFQFCSIEVDTRSVARMGATLAHGGQNVFTGTKVISENTVQNMLSLMNSCGMYDYSGEWSFTVGLPAKSGVSGVIMLILPNLGCLATWSPLLDHFGNSVRGVGFTQDLLARYHNSHDQNVFHPFSHKRARLTADRALHSTPGRRGYHTSPAGGMGPPAWGMGPPAGVMASLSRKLLTIARYIR